MTDIWHFIVSKRGTIYRKTQEPFIRLITVYTKNGVATDFAVTAKRERLKKASQVGLCQERKIVHLTDGEKISNPQGFNIEKGSFELIYYLDKKEIRVFRID